MHGLREIVPPKRKGLSEKRLRTLTETEKDEKKEGGDEHGPKLYASVEESE